MTLSSFEQDSLDFTKVSFVFFFLRPSYTIWDKVCIVWSQHSYQMIIYNPRFPFKTKGIVIIEMTLFFRFKLHFQGLNLNRREFRIHFLVLRKTIGINQCSQVIAINSEEPEQVIDILSEFLNGGAAEYPFMIGLQLTHFLVCFPFAFRIIFVNDNTMPMFLQNRFLAVQLFENRQ